MTKTVTMNIRTDAQTRQDLQDFANHLGIPASSLVNASIKQMLRSQKVAFSTLEPSANLKKLIKQAEADYQAGKNVTSVKNRAQLKRFLDSL